MTQAIISLGNTQDRLLNIIKGKYGFKNKSDTVNFVIEKFGEELLEPELRPAYVQKIKILEQKGKLNKYRSLSALRADVEHA